MINANPIPQRLIIVDALRGLALFGILQLHSLEHFDFYFFPDLGIPFLKALDKVVWETVFFLFAGKSFAMFAMLFGLSFYIQMESRKQKNEDFRWRFLRRLFILLIIGVLHGLIFEGDVLRFLAIFGALLVVFYSLSNRLLVVLSFLLLLNLPRYWQLYQSFTIPDFELPKTPMIPLYTELGAIYVNGSFTDVLSAISWKGFMANAYFHLESGRYLQIPGLFIWGLLLGRTKFFYDIDIKQQTLLKFVGISFVLFSIFYSVKLIVPAANISKPSKEIIDILMGNYSNISFMVFLASGFVWFCTRDSGKFLVSLLSPYGRMSLTNYVSMGLCLIPVYYGYGLAMYQYCGATICLFIGLSFFTLQLWISHVWMQHFHYGPLEWFWRYLTFL